MVKASFLAPAILGQYTYVNPVFWRLRVKNGAGFINKLHDDLSLVEFIIGVKEIRLMGWAYKFSDGSRQKLKNFQHQVSEIGSK